MTDAWMTMIFRHGFFHGDPHPANILLLDDGRIGLVDFGLAGRLTDEDMTRLTRLFVDAATENVDALPRRLAELGLRYPKEREEELRDAIEELFYRYYGSSISSIDPIEVIREGARPDLLAQPAAAEPVRDRSTRRSRRSARSASSCIPDFNVFEVARPYARRLIAERFSPRRMSLRAQTELRELGGVARELPYQLRDVMEQTRQGKLEIQIRNPGFDDLTYHIDHAVNRIAVALIVLGGLVGSSIVGVLAKNGPHVMGLHLLSFVGFVISGHLRGLARLGDRPVGEAVGRRRSGVRLQPDARFAAARAPQQLQHGLVGQGADDASLAPVGVDCRPERVEHRLLGRFDDGREERVQVLVGNRGAIDAERSRSSRLDRRRREREEDLAAPVVGDRAGPREAEPRAPREPLELRRLERRVGRDDRDAAAGRGPRVDAVADRREHRHAVDPQVAGGAEVREHEHADRRVDLGDEPAGRPDPALPAERDHPGPRADTPLIDGAVRARRRRHARRPPPRPGRCARR